MDEFIKNKKIIFICFILIILSVSLYFLINDKKEIPINKEQGEFLKHYNANEYNPIYINDEKVADIYLNEYKSYMINDVEKAYNMLNKEYREKKFKTLDKFEEYLKNYLTIEVINSNIDKYDIKTINGNKIFNIYDNNENHYIIKEKSIMNYEIYLDDYTVNIE